MLWKKLVAAATEPLVLSLLGQGETYRYAIFDELRTPTDGRLQWTDGMLYPVLHRMERRGRIESRWDGRETGRKRKYYTLKKEGKAAMPTRHAEWWLVHGVLSDLQKERYV